MKKISFFSLGQGANFYFLFFFFGPVPLLRRFHGADFRGYVIFQKVNDRAMNNLTFLTTRN